MAMSFSPFLVAWLWLWSPLALLTTVGGRRRGQSVGRAAMDGLIFPATWVVWLIVDNHREGRTAFRSR